MVGAILPEGAGEVKPEWSLPTKKGLEVASRWRGRSWCSSVVWKRRAVDRVARAAPAALAAAGSRAARGAAPHESAGERRGLLAILFERGLKPREGPVTLRQADSVYRSTTSRAVPENGRTRQEDGAQGPGGRCRKSLMSAVLHRTTQSDNLVHDLEGWTA